MGKDINDEIIIAVTYIERLDRRPDYAEHSIYIWRAEGESEQRRLTPLIS